MDVTIRRAAGPDARAASDLYLRARRAAAETASIPSPAHSDDEVAAWIEGVIIPQLDCWLAQTASEQVVGILVLRGDWIDQLYVDPNLTGRGIGAELLALAKRERPQRLRLWTFVSNEKIRRGAARSERQARTAERSFTRGRDEKRALGRPKFSTAARQVTLPRNVLFRRRRGLVLFDQGGGLGTYAWRTHTELKSLVSMEIPDGLEGYGPDDPAHFGISVMACLGTADSDKVDSFDVVVCTPGCMDSENR